MTQTYAEMLGFIENEPVVSTHAHQDFSLDGESYNLDVLFANSYVKWCHVPWDDSLGGRQNFLDKVRYNSYFTWLEKALRAIYRLEEPLLGSDWGQVSEMLRSAHLQPGYWESLLTRLCRYQRIIEDAYWDPGSNNGRPELFSATFRVNSFFFGYRPEVRDHDGNNALQLYRAGQPVEDLDEYVAFLKEHILHQKEQGCVALKLPIAYDRGLDFVEVTHAAARSAYQHLRELREEAGEVKAFQDYLLYQVCKIAAEVDLPLQIHTGMGKIQRSQAIWLEEAIRKNSHTRFVLLHCGLPLTDDILALVRYFPNVYPDLSHAPMFSSFATRKLISELIEAGAESKICWGCDTWTPEESYGSLLALRDVLAGALADKIDQGYLSQADARLIARHILRENALKLYRLG